MTERRPLPRQLRYSRRRFLRRGAFAASVRMSGLLCVFALQVLLARLIADAAQYGQYAWGQSLLFLAGNLACIGLPLVTARFIASLDAHHNPTGAAAVIAESHRLLRRSTGALLVVAALLWLFSRGGSEGGFFGSAAVIALVFAPAVTFAMLYRDMSRARQWLGLAMLPVQVLRPIVTALLAALSWWLLDGELSGSLTLALVGTSTLLVLLPQAWIYRIRQRRLVDDSPAPVPPEYTPSRLLATAVPVFITRCASLVITYGNVLLVGFLAGPAMAGAFFAAERLAQLASIPKAVVSMVNQQSMAAAHATDNVGDLQLLATQSAHGSLWPTLAASLGLIIFAEPLLRLFGDDFAAASGVLIILVASGIIHVFAGPAQDILVMTGRQGRIPRIMIIAAICHIVVLLLLVPILGAVGAAVASVCSSVVSQVWLMLLASREAGVATTVLASLRNRR
ncbi:MAG: lipopolysaccharide biosynthesis protein [Halioglobus sp.]|nr:lipopolysaccharide biosynthesis protein [Halioglobus sp.]